MRTLCFFLMLLSSSLYAQPIAFAVHGGAGAIDSTKMSPALREAIQATLTEAVQLGYAILERGGSSVDAAQAAVVLLENSPLFNAGKGAVTTAEGFVELDAAIMDGKTGKAGAVAALRHIQNPVLLARRVMDSSRHVFLIGDGAEAFARSQGFVMTPQAYFLERSPLKGAAEELAALQGDKYGTVGAVALDKQGNLAAATSTGGMQNKKFGRVGDVPVIGAGTYARNGVVAVSCTGHGEYFIREVVGHEVASLMRYKGLSLAEAADKVVLEQLVKIGGSGGLIAVDAEGNIHMPFNSPAMMRASKDAKGRFLVRIYR
jgi:L-asparaginase / beta-aspartyl-peptidase